jgi:hypothetical protein
MNSNEKQDLYKLISSVMDYYKQDVSPFSLNLFWEALKGFDFEQVSKALTRHAMNPDNGQFAPKIADIVKQLSGTTSDKAKIAWGKAYAAMEQVGAYQDVCFDDGIIHLVIEDMGGWVKICRTETKDIGYVQHQFCESYRAYTGRERVEYPSYLAGANGTGENMARLRMRGITPPAPITIGDREKANAVLISGSNQSRISGAKSIQSLVLEMAK